MNDLVQQLGQYDYYVSVYTAAVGIESTGTFYKRLWLYRKIDI